MSTPTLLAAATKMLDELDPSPTPTGSTDTHRRAPPLSNMPQIGPTEGWIVFAVVSSLILASILFYTAWHSLLDPNNPDDIYDEVIVTEKDKWKPKTPLELALLDALDAQLQNHRTNLNKRKSIVEQARRDQAIHDYEARMDFTRHKCSSKVNPLRINLPSYETADAHGHDLYTRLESLRKQMRQEERLPRAIAAYEERMAYTKRKCDITQSHSLEATGLGGKVLEAMRA